MEFVGTVTQVLPIKSGGSAEKPWQSQEFIVKENKEQYPKSVCFRLFGEDKIAQYNVAIGKVVKVSFDIEAREWQGRWFNNINAWKVEYPESTQAVSQTVVPQQESPMSEPQYKQASPNAGRQQEYATDDDDLPF